jgi:hypothetical protein
LPPIVKAGSIFQVYKRLIRKFQFIKSTGNEMGERNEAKQSKSNQDMAKRTKKKQVRRESNAEAEGTDCMVKM